MLTNTVILLLRDILPIFVFAVYLKHVFGSNVVMLSEIKWHLASVLALVTLITIFIEHITGAFSGAGYELLNLTVNALVVGLLIMAIWQHNTVQSKHYTRLALVFFAVLKLTGFTLFAGTVDVDQLATMTLVGLAFGVAICLSVSILLSFLLSQLKQFSKFVMFSLFAMFVASQAAGITLLLQQVDWIEGYDTAYDLSWLVSDKSEYGHVLKTLVGFEASPSYDFLAVYIGVFVVLMLLANYRAWQHFEHTSFEAEGV